MKNTLRIAASLLCVAMLGACSGGTPADSTKKSTSGSEKTSTSSKASTSSSASSSQASSQGEQSQASSEQSTSEAQPSADASVVPDGAEQLEMGESETAALIAGKLAMAYTDQGGSVSEIDNSISDTGNAISSFAVDLAGYPVYVFVTAAGSAGLAQETFDANSTDDENGGELTVMNEWSNNDNTVRVIRNNMSNVNYVEVLDLHQCVTIHIQDEVPEQLESTLNVLNAVSYPVSD